MLKLLATGLALGCLSLAAWMDPVSPPAEAAGGQELVQPLGFSHKKHMAEDMACVECHLRVEEGALATLPPTKVCMLCHEEPQGEEPEEAKVREYADLGDYIPWKVFNRSEGHVFFSHEAHVVWGAISCEECHQDVRELDEPYTASDTDHLDMDACMDCHTERGTSNDCNLCHK
jgi:hypothetical protein